MLGLRYGTVTLVSYTPEWAEAFKVESLRLREALLEFSCEIEHIGSTAVPGMDAKPILDIAVGTSCQTPVERLFAAIQLAGYEYRGDAGAEGGHVFVRETSPHIRTHHLHVVSCDDPQWDQYLRFRDLLRDHAGARELYMAQKRALALRYPTDRKAYTAGKRELVTSLLELHRPQ
jgi:GrpB-like predicted nucleotidyltransferase (UPF0157 family)